MADAALACADADEFIDVSDAMLSRAAIAASVGALCWFGTTPGFDASVAASGCADAGSSVMPFTLAAAPAGSCEAEAEAALAKVAAKRCGALPPTAFDAAAPPPVESGSAAWRSAVTLRATVAAAIAGVSVADASRAGAADFSSADATVSAAGFASPAAGSPAGEATTSGSISSPLNNALTGTD